MIVREDAPGARRLVAYLVPESSPGPSIGDLRRELATTLPGYMVPSSFVLIPRLPLTPNGKVDRRALPEPDASSPEPSRFIPPRTPIEEIVVSIWSGVLGSDRVGVEDNFFELGGHSLRAVRIISRVRDLLGVDLSVRAFFETPTVAGMAAAIERELGDPSGS